MGYTADDAASDAYYAAQEAEDLEATTERGRQLVEEFLGAWADHQLSPGLAFSVEAGGDDQPLFVFTIQVSLEEDFDAAEWPADAVEELTADLRSRISGTEIDNWDWFVGASIKVDVGSP